MRRQRVFLAALISAAMVAPVAIAAGSTASAMTVPTLVGVRAAHQPGYDRVVFDFTGGLPSTRSVEYVAGLVGDGSGLPVPIAGRAILQVRMSPTNAHDDGGRVTAPASVAFPLPNVMTVVRSGDFEAVTTYGIGLAKKETFKVFTLRNPDRLVIDIKAELTTAPRLVYFLDENNFNVGTEPYFVSVPRPVPWPASATGVLDRIFAGPLPREHARGLRVLLSKATGFTNLRISDGVARVQLTGGCGSGGSTVTIAGLITPSLKQFSTVDFVKIYDPKGNTERPTGRSDSIPECLEP